MRSGLAATMIEAPLEVQKQGLQIGQDFLDLCKASGIPTEGNAAGNTMNLMDLTGANVQPGPLPEGFTPRGIAALVMSIICAFVGMGVITWYVVSSAYHIDTGTRPRIVERFGPPMLTFHPGTALATSRRRKPRGSRPKPGDWGEFAGATAAPDKALIQHVVDLRGALSQRHAYGWC